jgi:hypothetical protein
LVFSKIITYCNRRDWPLGDLRDLEAKPDDEMTYHQQGMNFAKYEMVLC